jgi:hypothetical protein
MLNPLLYMNIIHPLRIEQPLGIKQPLDIKHICSIQYTDTIPSYPVYGQSSPHTKDIYVSLKVTFF